MDYYTLSGLYMSCEALFRYWPDGSRATVFVPIRQDGLVGDGFWVGVYHGDCFLPRAQISVALESERPVLLSAKPLDGSPLPQAALSCSMDDLQQYMALYMSVRGFAFAEVLTAEQQAVLTDFRQVWQRVVPAGLANALQGAFPAFFSWVERALG